MRYQRFYFLVFSAPILLLLSFLLPASIANAANVNMSVHAAAPPNWFFPCSDRRIPRRGISQPSEAIIKRDWLSGDGGHFSTTYAADTYKFPQVSMLFGYMEVLAFVLITPSIMLLGYQIMLGASTFRYANALEGLSRVVLGGLAVAASFALVQLLINLENILTTAIVILHSEQPFPQSTVNGTPVLYAFLGEPAASYRGLVMPMSRWGCAINDFVGIFSPTLVRDLASNIPLMRHFIPLAGSAKTIADLIRRLGGMGLMALSILLWMQVFARILLLNYYILMAPLAFGCWGLPEGVGQNVVRLWAKGFLAVLFVQAIQLFIITTLPLILPSLPQSFFSISLGHSKDGAILQTLLLQFPPLLTLSLTLMAPTLVGASIGQTLGSVGSVTKEVVIAVGSGIGAGRDSLSPKRKTGSGEGTEEQYAPGKKWALTRRARKENQLSEKRNSSLAYTKRG
jgi:hypothetical protein